MKNLRYAPTIEDTGSGPVAEERPNMNSWMANLGPIETPMQPNEKSATPPAEKVVEAAPEPKVVEPKTVEAKAEPEVKAPETVEDKWPRSAKDWDAFKTARKAKEDALTGEKAAIQAELANTKAEIEKLRKQGPSPELDALRKERDQFEQQLKLVAVEHHPKFKAYFENKTNAQIDLAKRVVGTEREAEIARILGMPESPLKEQQLDELMLGMSPLQQSRLGGVINSLAQIQQEREGEIANARANYDTMMKEQEGKSKLQQEQQSKAIEQGFATSLEKAQKLTGEAAVFQKKEGTDAATIEWNKGVDERISQAKQLIFGQNKSDDLIQAALCAAAMPHLAKRGAEMEAELTKLRAQVKALTAATPGVQEGERRTSDEPGAQPLKPGSNPMDAAAHWTKNLPRLGQNNP